MPKPQGCGASRAENPAFIDAYLATVYSHPDLLLDHLEQGLLDAGFDTRREDGPPIRFYGRNALLLDPSGHRLVQVRYPGKNPHPFVEAKGPVSPIVAQVLRERFNHSPSRIDSAVDLRGPEVFDQLHRLAQRYEGQKSLKLDYDGAAPDNPDRGTTIYLGSRKSQVFVRIYQKGLKHAAEIGLSPSEIPDELRHWVRIELELKPDKRPARMRARHLSPAAIWGCSPWTAEFAMEALAIDAERVHMQERRESNHDRAMRFLVQQYGPTILKQVENLGSWDRFTADLQERLGVLEPV